MSPRYAFTIFVGSGGGSPGAILSTASMPDNTRPKIEYWPVMPPFGPNMMKNWLLALFGSDVRAAPTVPRRKRALSVNSAGRSGRLDPPLPVPNAVYLLARGPFAQTAERELLLAHTIDAIVAKNSGGEATYGKIAAARALGIEIIMLRRPQLPEVPSVASVDEAAAWLDHALASVAARGV